MLEITVQTSYSGEWNDIWRFDNTDEAARIMVERDNMGMIKRVISITGMSSAIERYTQTVDSIAETAEQLNKLATDQTVLWITDWKRYDKR